MLSYQLAVLKFLSDTHVHIALCLIKHKHDILSVQNLTMGLFSSSSTDLKDEEEDVNNVNVERESAVDVLLWADGQLPISNKKLRVVY